MAISHEKEIKGIHTGTGEVELSLLVDDMILNIKKPKEYTHTDNLS